MEAKAAKAIDGRYKYLSAFKVDIGIMLETGSIVITDQIRKKRECELNLISFIDMIKNIINKIKNMIDLKVISIGII